MQEPSDAEKAAAAAVASNKPPATPPGPGRGGKRPGAGRKAAGAAPLKPTIQKIKPGEPKPTYALPATTPLAEQQKAAKTLDHYGREKIINGLSLAIKLPNNTICKLAKRVPFSKDQHKESAEYAFYALEPWVHRWEFVLPIMFAFAYLMMFANQPSIPGAIDTAATEKKPPALADSKTPKGANDAERKEVPGVSGGGDGVWSQIGDLRESVLPA